MIYLVILILLVAISFYYDICNRNNKKHLRSSSFWYILICICFIALAGLRDITIGADTSNYYRDFNTTPTLAFLHSNDIEASRYQPLWIVLVSFTKTLFGDFTFLLLFQAIFVNVVLFKFFKKNTTFPFICITIYFCSFFIEFNMEIMRESIALCFCLLAYEQYENKHWIIAILLWFIGYNFHISAVIALLFPLFSKFKYSKSHLIILTIICSILLIVFPLISQYITAIELFLQLYLPSLADSFNTYINTDINEEFNSNYFISLLFVRGLIPISLLAYLSKDNKYFGFISAFIVLKILSTFTYAFYRFANYEAAFYIIFLSSIIMKLIIADRKQYAISSLKYLSVILLCLYTFQNMQLLDDPDGGYRYERYIPYKSIFDVI